jgi:hypothetical protein
VRSLTMCSPMARQRAISRCSWRAGMSVTDEITVQL